MATYQIDSISVDKRGNTYCRLNQQKDGCHTILFERDKNPELKTLLLSFFEKDKPFTFDIESKRAGGMCLINRVERRQG